MKTAGPFVLVILAAGCASPPPKAPPSREPPAPKVTAEELTAEEPKVAPVVLTLLRDGQAALILHKDGKLDIAGQKPSAGTLGADGRFVDPNGKLLAQLTADGEVVIANGDYLPVTIDADGTAHLPKEQRTLRIRVDGSVEGANPNGPVVRFEGLSENNRRTAMFLLVLAAFPVKKQ